MILRKCQCWPKKRSGKKKRREGGGGEGGGESGSIIDDAQSHELATRVVGSPQEMEKPVEFDYDVFLSFRGPDARLDIADCLYTSLTDFGIRAFRDNEELHVGKEIGPALFQAIKRSKISIPIFSIGYAESEWCLMELVQMVECMEKWGQEIMPIFYKVKPSEVRNQKKAYGAAIKSHRGKRLYNKTTIQNWKAALNKVGNLKGWEPKESGIGEFTQKVAQELLIKLETNHLAVPDYLVKMDDHVDEIMELIEQTTETKIVGIHGMGGVGKTTLATIIYNKLLANSTNCCFLSNFKNTKIEDLQEQLISGILKKRVPIRNRAEGIIAIKESLSSKKVLLLLDDVDQKTQLDALIGMGKCWFCRGSKVIITTRNKEVLKDVDLKHGLSEMDFDRSLLLFSRHAFRRDCPPAKYKLLSKKAVKVCGYLPLALEIIGSFLHRRDRKFWKITLDKLKSIPDKNVKEKLNISIDALEHHAKEIFLDVCCFFVEFDVRIVKHMWKSCGFYPDFYLDVLQQNSLIKITKRNRLWMHDIVRDIGRNFVSQNGNYKPQKQSRVWGQEEAIDVLETKEGRENVEAICLKFNQHLKFIQQFQDFMGMEESVRLSNLRFLQVDCVDSKENNSQQFPSINWVERNPIILPNLIWLSWHNFPVFFKFTALSFKKLVILDLSKSEITDEWEGWNHLKTAENLKVLNLTDCENLLRTPDFSGHKNLEELILQGCRELVQVDRSIGELKHLVLLNLKYCGALRTLPNEMEGLEALTKLLVDDTSITKIPEWKGMKKLETLSAEFCALSECNLAGCSTSLSYLNLSSTEISELPFGNFGSLVELDVSNSNIQELSNSIETMKNLRVLRIFMSNLEKLPSALGMLKKLEEINAESCRNLCGEIPSDIGELSFLRILRLSGTRISNVPKLPNSMIELHLSGNPQMRCPDLSNLLNLKVLSLGLSYQSPSHPAPNLNWIGGLRKLESLWLGCDNLVALPSNFNLLSKLKKLDLLVNNLECLPKLPQNLSYFCFVGRRLTEKSIDLSYLEKLSFLKVYYCEQLKEIQGLEPLENLRTVYLEDLPSLVKLPDLTGLKKLWRLFITCCPKLVEVRGQLESLESLYLSRCESLEQLPDPFSFKHIEELCISGCWKLKEIQGLEVSKNLKVLSMGDLPLLEKLPDLTNIKELKEFSLWCCPHLVEIRGRLESVVLLRIDGCGSLQNFSDPSSFEELKYLEIKECERLEEILESDEYRYLKKVRRPYQEFYFTVMKSGREDTVSGW